MAGTLPPRREANPQGRPVEHGPSRIYAAGVVLAVPAWEAAILAPDSLGQDAARWAQLQPSPVMSIHVVYGSRVTTLPFAAAADSPVHWVMDKTAAAGLHAGQYLAASVRAAEGYLDTPVAQLRAEFLPAMERLFPAAAEASVEDFFVTRERRATIAHVPGSLRLRAGGPRLAGFALAGAWTDTGWPDTMEGAVRSGQTAAQKLIEELPARARIWPVRSRPAGSRAQCRPVQSRTPQCRPTAVPASSMSASAEGEDAVVDSADPAGRARPESSEAASPALTQPASSSA